MYMEIIINYIIHQENLCGKHKRFLKQPLRIFTTPLATVNDSKLGMVSPKAACGRLLGPASGAWSHHFDMSKPVMVPEDLLIIWESSFKNNPM